MAAQSNAESILYGAPQRFEKEQLVASGNFVPYFESCGCHGGYADCVGPGNPACCGACYEPCSWCQGYSNILVIACQHCLGQGCLECDQTGEETITFDKASEAQINLAANREERHLHSEFESKSGDPLVSAGAIPF